MVALKLLAPSKSAKAIKPTKRASVQTGKARALPSLAILNLVADNVIIATDKFLLRKCFTQRFGCTKIHPQAAAGRGTALILLLKVFTGPQQSISLARQKKPAAGWPAAGWFNRWYCFVTWPSLAKTVEGGRVCTGDRQLIVGANHGFGARHCGPDRVGTEHWAGFQGEPAVHKGPHQSQAAR